MRSGWTAPRSTRSPSPPAAWNQSSWCCCSARAGHAPPAGFERDFPQLLLAPLSAPDAGRLLDAQPHPPRGRAREQVLAQAAGNPLALIELAKVIAADPDAGRRWAAEPIPLTGRLTAIMTARYAALPGTARAALLLAAVADSPDLAAAAVPGLSAGALAPAEAAGLIRVDTAGPQFTHPLVRAAVYHAAPFAERAAAHLTDGGRPPRPARPLRLAPGRRGAGTRRARGLRCSRTARPRRSAAAAPPRRRGPWNAPPNSAPASRTQARRLLAAAGLALPAGQADWVRELAGKVLTLTRTRTCASPPGCISAGRCCGRTGTPTRSTRSSPSPPRHPRAAGPRVGRHRAGRHGRPPDRAPRACAKARAALTRSTPWASRCRRPRTGRPAARTRTGYGSRHARTRSAEERKPFPTCTG